MAATGKRDTKPALDAKPLVLAVDDDPSILRFIKILLEGDGFEVKTAVAGEEALLLLRDFVPVVLILDVELPGISGFDLCQIVKRNKRLEGVPVIFLTGHGTPADYQTGHQAGAVAYVAKPCSPHHLLELVRMLAAPGSASA